MFAPGDVQQTKWQRWADLLARIALLIVAVAFTFGLIIGSLVVIPWPFLCKAGSGFGGGWGLSYLARVASDRHSASLRACG